MYFPNHTSFTNISSLSFILAFWEVAFFNIYLNIYIILIINSSLLKPWNNPQQHFVVLRSIWYESWVKSSQSLLSDGHAAIRLDLLNIQYVDDVR